MSLWAVFFFVFLGISLLGWKRTKANNEHRPINPKIASFTKAIFIFGTLFYSVSFSKIGQLKLGIFENYEFFILSTGLTIVIIGMAFMLISRWQLRSLSNKDVFFSINNTKLVTDGLYRYMKHPMYMGLLMIFLGSIVIYKNPLSLIFFLAILYLIRQKINLEEKFGGAKN